MISVIIGIIILVIALVLMLSDRKGHKSGLIQLSHLKCSKCDSEFDYVFLPGGSFASIRHGIQVPEVPKLT